MREVPGDEEEMWALALRAGRTTIESEEKQDTWLQRAGEAASQQGQAGARGPSHLLSNYGMAAHTKGLLISELGFNFSKSVSSAVKWTQTSGQGAGKASVCVACSPMREIWEHWQLAGQGKWEEERFNSSCSRLLTFADALRKCKFSNEGRTIKLLV